jgi:hypothetical protein
MLVGLLRKRTEARQIAHEQSGLGALRHYEDFSALPPCARPHFGESGFFYDIRG